LWRRSASSGVGLSLIDRCISAPRHDAEADPDRRRDRIRT